jgi:hypothetical protein
MRANLVYRGIEVAGGTAGCVHYQGPVETETHIFLFCDLGVEGNFSAAWVSNHYTAQSICVV